MTSMGTWESVMELLSACERQIVAIRLKSEEKRRIEEDRLAQVAAKRQECLQGHERRLKDQMEEYERQLQNVVEKMDEEIAVTVELKAQAAARLREAEAKAVASEREARELERQVGELHALLDQLEAEHDQKFREVLDKADSRFERRQEDTLRTIRNTMGFASTLQAFTLRSIDDMHQELRATIRSAEYKSADGPTVDKAVFRSAPWTAPRLLSLEGPSSPSSSRPETTPTFKLPGLDSTLGGRSPKASPKGDSIGRGIGLGLPEIGR